MPLEPFRVLPLFHEKVWGTGNLAPWFPRSEQKIGEVWFTSDGNRTELGPTLREVMERHGPDLLGRGVSPGFGGRFPLLVKFIFTSERLSIQAHPDDKYGEMHEASPGKTEMWHILRAEPEASIAAGFEESLTEERLRASALNGEIERLVKWWPAEPGQTYFVPARTVHAIGAGLAVCEIQQNSDITYRLYDYGRPRELHLDRGVAVADLEPYPGPAAPVALAAGGQLLATCPYFATELHEPAGPLELAADPQRFHLLIALEGEAALGDERIKTGEVWVIPASAGAIRLEPGQGFRMLRTCVPEGSYYCVKNRHVPLKNY
jgi:mannose-6-phosphate isomerase